MNKKRIAIKVYLEAEDEIFKRVETLAEQTSLSLSSVAGMALRHGLPSVEQTMNNLYLGTLVSYDGKKIDQVQTTRAKRKPKKA